MARINIDDDLESKHEFWKLTKMVGCPDKARGMLVRFFRIAQKAFTEDRAITEAEITDNELASVPAAGWAMPAEGGGYRAKGVKEQFAWLASHKKSASAGGAARVKTARRDEKGRLMPADVQPESSGDQPEPAESSALTLSPSLSLTQIKKEELKECAPAHSVTAAPVSVSKADPRKATPTEKHGISRVIAAYIPAWQARYNTRARPDVGAVARGILRRLVRDHPTDYLCELIQVYCQMKLNFFDTRKHDLATFERCFNQIALAHDKGDESAIDWAKVFGDDDGTKRVSGADSTAGCDLQRESLPIGTG